MTPHSSVALANIDTSSPIDDRSSESHLHSFSLVATLLFQISSRSKSDFLRFECLEQRLREVDEQLREGSARAEQERRRAEEAANKIRQARYI